MANSSGSTPSRRTSAGRFVVFIGLALTALFLLLKVTSPGPTVSYWEGSFPSGEFHLKIRNEHGDPIPGAALNVFDSKTKSLSFHSLIRDYGSYNSLISDEDGTIVVLSIQDMGFGGSCWKQLWVFTVCSEPPGYYFAISADGYKTLWVSTEEFFAPAYNDREPGTTSVTRESGEVVELPVYEALFVLRR